MIRIGTLKFVPLCFDDFFFQIIYLAGTNFKEECGEIQCEVCRVSVNSSHQLQAHLAGHKHKVRCYKRGLDPCAALVTPTSTTPPSTAPSECSAPHSSVSSKYHQYTAATSSPSYRYVKILVQKFTTRWQSAKSQLILCIF